ncbi:MAG TPA: carboxymuconolactone decarboxylase family protein [Afifellaceae bacterium]|nr:carboxymuconolactone decarboxylase family protein [Afifellaceae bacterium]
MRGLQASRRQRGQDRKAIALALAVTTRCEGCVSAHAKKAVEFGASREEIAEVRRRGFDLHGASLRCAICIAGG